MNPRIELICVGTELLTGKLNTHTAYLGDRLMQDGFELTSDQTVSDDSVLMKEIFRQVWKRSDVIFCAGGLGPTFDDITREAWARVTGRRLHQDPRLLQEIVQKFKNRGLHMPPKNKRQADLLQGAEALPNINGTAPGQILHMGKKWLILLPGPARELIPMVENTIMPHLVKVFGMRPLFQKTFLMAGVPESKIDEMIRPMIQKYPRIQGCRVVYGILASQSIISVKIRLQGPTMSRVNHAASVLIPKFRSRLSTFIYGEDHDTLSGALGQLLRKKGETVAVAESCTGGLLGKMITDVSGSSEYFKEGVIAYANDAKMRALGVKNSTLEKYGAVSPQTAIEMSQGMRKMARVDYAVSTTGIAGPTGGTDKKPVGLVYVSIAHPAGVVVKKYLLGGSRDGIRHRTSVLALELLRRHLCHVTLNIF